MADELFIMIPAPRNLLAAPEHLLNSAKQDLLRAATVTEKMNAVEGLLRLYEACGLVEEGISAIREALKFYDLEGEDAAYLLLSMGQMYEQKYDFLAACECYLKSLEITNLSGICLYLQYNNTGFCLNYMKDFRKAEPYCRQAAKYEPKRYNAWKNLGVSLEYQGRFSEAAVCYALADKLQPHDPRARMHLNRLLERQEDKMYGSSRI